MNISKFQFSNPEIVAIDYRVNDKFIREKIDTEKIVSVTPIINVDIEKAAENFFAVVTMKVSIGTDKLDDEENQMPFSLSVSMRAHFKWTEEVNNQADDLLSKNASMLLLSYIRPLISTITGMYGGNVLNLPYADFRSMNINSSNVDKEEV